MKSLGKYSITISLIENGQVKEEIIKNRTIYQNNKDHKMFMFFKGKYIAVEQNGEQYFASFDLTEPVESK